MRFVMAAAVIALAPGILMAQERQAIYPAGERIMGPFTPAIRVGTTLYLSGQVGNVPGTRDLVPGGVGPQTRAILQSIGRVLEAAGSSYTKVHKCLVFLTDINDFAAMNEVYTTFFPADPPARSTVAVAALVLGARVEIECIATV